MIDLVEWVCLLLFSNHAELERMVYYCISNSPTITTGNIYVSQAIVQTLWFGYYADRH